MAIGPCTVLVCSSTLGTTYRMAAKMISIFGDEDGMREVVKFVETTVCPEHGRWLDGLRRKGVTIRYSREGWVYPESWMVAPLFQAW